MSKRTPPLLGPRVLGVCRGADDLPPRKAQQALDLDP